MTTLTFATGNPGKLEEARAQLAPLGVEVEGWDGGYPEVQADELAEVARFGLDHLAGRLEAPFVLEDAGLFVDAWDGFPGVYSSYAFATLGNEGLLELMRGVNERTARFRSVVGLRRDGEDHLFPGEVEGTIPREPRGDQGFGFDPVFQPAGRERTFAEMDQGEKTELSHRSRALEALADHLGR